MKRHTFAWGLPFYSKPCYMNYLEISFLNFPDGRLQLFIYYIFYSYHIYNNFNKKKWRVLAIWFGCNCHHNVLFIFHNIIMQWFVPKNLVWWVKPNFKLDFGKRHIWEVWPQIILEHLIKQVSRASKRPQRQPVICHYCQDLVKKIWE